MRVTTSKGVLGSAAFAAMVCEAPDKPTGRRNFQSLKVGKARRRGWDAQEPRSCGAAALHLPGLSCSPNPPFCTCLPLGPLKKKIPRAVLLFCWRGWQTFSFLFQPSTSHEEHQPSAAAADWGNVPLQTNPQAPLFPKSYSE